MKEKIVLITGDTSGLGKETSKVLAKRGYIVVIYGRSKTKAEATIQEIKKEVKNARLDTLIADLESLARVKKMKIRSGTTA